MAVIPPPVDEVFPVWVVSPLPIDPPIEIDPVLWKAKLF